MGAGPGEPQPGYSHRRPLGGRDLSSRTGPQSVISPLDVPATASSGTPSGEWPGRAPRRHGSVPLTSLFCFRFKILSIALTQVQKAAHSTCRMETRLLLRADVAPSRVTQTRRRSLCLFRSVFGNPLSVKPLKKFFFLNVMAIHMAQGSSWTRD